MLEYVREASSAKELNDNMISAFQRHTLLNKLRVRRAFYIVETKHGEKLISYLNLVQQFSLVLKSMEVEIDNKSVSLAILKRLLTTYEYIITTLNKLENDNAPFRLDLVKIRLLQEEQHRDVRLAASTDTALFGSSEKQSHKTSSRPLTCSYGKRRGQLEETCWDKFPSLRARGSQGGSLDQAGQSFPASDVATSDGRNPVKVEKIVSLIALNESKAGCDERYIESCTSGHTTYDHKSFFNLRSLTVFSVQLKSKTTTEAIALKTANLSFLVNGQVKKCSLRNVNLVSFLQYSLIFFGTLDEHGTSVLFSTNGGNIVNDDLVCTKDTKKGMLSRLRVRKKSLLWYRFNMYGRSKNLASKARACASAENS